MSEAFVGLGVLFVYRFAMASQTDEWPATRAGGLIVVGLFVILVLVSFFMARSRYNRPNAATYRRWCCFPNGYDEVVSQSAEEIEV